MYLPTNTPTVSVLMSVYNNRPYLAEAVESVLAQTVTDFELIVVDDGSTDDSLALLRTYADRDPRVRLVSRPNTGISRALNDGLKLARGEFIAKMDSDDVAYPRRFAEQLDFLRRRLDHVCVGSSFDLIDEKGRLLTAQHPPSDDGQIQRALLVGHGAINHSSAMMRRRALEAIGGYDEYFTVNVDLDLFLRLGEQGKLANLPAVLSKYRLHSGGISEKKRVEQRRMGLEACERAWKRRGIEGRFEASEPWRPGKDRASRHAYALKYGWWAFNSGQRRTALHYAARALRALPWRLAGWRLLVCAAIKPVQRRTVQTGPAGSAR